MKALPIDWADMFPGGVPGWVIFGMQVDDIRKLLNAELSEPHKSTFDRSYPEIAFIGLVAHFEGMVRYHFASLINVCPRLIARYSAAKPDMNVSLRDIAQFESLHGSVGFLIADSADFSSPREINAQYRALMGITPFGRSDAAEYDVVLNDRHQLVHSAGMYTTRYLRTHRTPIEAGRDRVYMDSIQVSRERTFQVADFLQRMTETLVTSTHDALCRPENWHSADELESMREPLHFFKWSIGAFESDPDEGE
jgi:hypothetical protein